jgi:hypothetical protein
MHSAFRVGLAGLVLMVGSVPARGQTSAIVGSWRGTSICVDREHYPACKDEQVIYEARVSHTSPDTVTIRADKVVDGNREFMGEYAFTLQEGGSWTSEAQTSRYHLLLRLQLAGDRLTGTLTDLASGHRVRDIALERAK